MTDESLEHWLKPDHMSFLLMLPLTIAGFFYSEFLVALLLCWVIAFFYDLTEKVGKEDE